MTSPTRANFRKLRNVAWLVLYSEPRTVWHLTDITGLMSKQNVVGKPGILESKMVLISSIPFSYPNQTWRHPGAFSICAQTLSATTSWAPTMDQPLWKVFLFICSLTPSTESRWKLKKEADHSRLVGGRFHKQENLLTKLVLGDHKMNRSLLGFTCQNLKSLRRSLIWV